MLANLRAAIAPKAGTNVHEFVIEAIRCLENNLYRPGIVFAWVGAVAVLYAWIINNKKKDFNTAATARFADWKAASNEGQLANMKEANFLQVLLDIGVIDKSTKKSLDGCLDLRNGCGHPNNLQVGEHIAAAHVETLLKNVFLKFT